jgi:hypothetical protein
MPRERRDMGRLQIAQSTAIMGAIPFVPARDRSKRRNRACAVGVDSAHQRSPSYTSYKARNHASYWETDVCRAHVGHVRRRDGARAG